MGIYQNKRNETKNMILKAFWALYQKKEISRITVRELTETCGIHRSTFYLHYQDLYDILEQIEQHLLSQKRIASICIHWFIIEKILIFPKPTGRN